jgi:hypothetical protein
MLVSDILHEFGLGEAKCLLVHLFQIIEAIQRREPTLSSLLTEINERYDIHSMPASFKSSLSSSRYRQVPTFGHSIRRFGRNVSDMKKMAARDIEDIMQACYIFLLALRSCVIPVLHTCFLWHLSIKRAR